MKGILDRFAAHYAPAINKQFIPATAAQFAALRIAERLNDAPAFRHYLDLCERHGEDRLVAAYRQAVKGGTTDLVPHFHSALEGKVDDDLPQRDLASIRIERRAVAVVIFRGNRLKYPPIARQLSSDTSKAMGSAAMFISHIRDKCHFLNAAVEKMPSGGEVQRSQLTRIIADVLAQERVVVWEFPKADVLAAYGHPPLRFRAAVRHVTSAMWPEVNGGLGSPLIRDALALGLYCQVEHLLEF